MFSSTTQLIDKCINPTPGKPLKSEDRKELAEKLLKLCLSIASYDKDYSKKAQQFRENRYRLQFRELFGERYYRKDFTNYQVNRGPDQQCAFDTCREFAKQIDKHIRAGNWLLLFGNKGTGKDHLSRAILMEAIRRGYQVEFGTIDKIIRRIREGWRDNRRTEQQIISYFCRVDLLLIQEIGVLGRSDDAKAKTFEILDERYSRQRATIITSNLMGQEQSGAQTVYGVDFWKYINFFGHDRLIDRFQEICTTVPFTWESNRGSI